MALAIKIAITPKASGQPSYEILDLIVVNGRAYLSLKDENTSVVTDTAAWTQITENTYDIAVRLGYVGTEAQWLASLSAASEAAAVIALDAAGDANDAATAANAAAGLAQDAATSANTAAANITSTVPWSLYRSRVLADSGVISDLEKLTKLYIENLKLLDNTVFMWDGSAGIKTRTSGANTYAAKAYDMSSGNRDAVQATEANQPFVVGSIAPNEKRGVKAVTNSSVFRRMVISPAISFSSGDEWSVSFVANSTGQLTTTGIIGNFGDRGIVNDANIWQFRDYSNGDFKNIEPSKHNTLVGKNQIITLVAKLNNIYFFRNGSLLKTTPFTSTQAVFSSFLNGYSSLVERTFTGGIYNIQIFNKALSAAEVQAQHAYLRLQHPEIEGINIGNQHWATSNYEGVVTGNGTVIPEVQDNAAWAALTTPAWCYYDNDPLNGAVYGKLYNWYAVQAIAANPPAGWKVPTEADFLQLANYLGGASVAGGKMKKEGLSYFNTPNTAATNESGFSATGGGLRRANGSFTYYKVLGTMATANKYLSNTYYGYCVIYNSGVLSQSSYHEAVTEKSGQYIRLIRNEPVGATERTVETGYITNALGATNLDIPIPFGYQVESIRFDSETNITGLSAKLLTGALVELETLFTAKSVTANVQKVIAADSDQSIQQTDAVVRINGTKALTSARFRVWIKLTKVVFS